MSNFVTMELSNESGIGDFEYCSKKSMVKSIGLKDRRINVPTIDKYVFFATLNQSRQMKEDSTDRSTSSGYASMPSTSSSDGSIDSENSLNFSVAPNSCVICSSRFKSVGELMMHLEFR